MVHIVLIGGYSHGKQIQCARLPDKVLTYFLGPGGGRKYYCYTGVCQEGTYFFTAE